MVKRKTEVALSDADQHNAIREKYMKTDRVSTRRSCYLIVCYILLRCCVD